MHFSADCKNGGGENRAGREVEVFSGVFVLPIRLLDRQDVFRRKMKRRRGFFQGGIQKRSKGKAEGVIRERKMYRN